MVNNQRIHCLKNTLSILISTLSLVMSYLLMQPSTISAAYTSGANIIDNSVFLNSKSMSISSIQSFLVARGSGLANYSVYFNCYAQDSKERQWYTAAGAPCDQNASAATVIYYTSQIYGINPQVVLATLQKEQSLITSPNPTSWQLNQAMGYGCPTTGGCGASNFFYQLDHGVWVLRYHYERARGNMDWWKPSTSWVCGTPKNFYKPSLYPHQNVNFYDEDGVHYRTYWLANAATSSMYCYTPHTYNNPQGLYGRPPYGTVGRYYSGSYNFVNSFYAWFGSPLVSQSFIPLEQPRYMELTKDVYKRDVSTLDLPTVDWPLTRGTHLKFTTKILINGEWYLRTEYDSAFQLSKAISINDVQDITYTDFVTPRYMQISSTTHKRTPRTEKIHNDLTLVPGSTIHFSSKITVSGKEYFRSTYDTLRDADKAIPADSVHEVTFEPFEMPRYMQISQPTTKINPATGSNDQTNIPEGTQYKFKTKTLVGDKWYYRTEQDTDNNSPFAIDASYISEIPFTNLGTSSRWFQLKSNTQKLNASTGISVDFPLPLGMKLQVTSSQEVNGTLYYRTAYDTEHNLNKVIESSNFELIPFVPLENPRNFKLRLDTFKVDPSTGQNVDSKLGNGSTLMFTTKVLIDGVWYLRTEYDTHNDYYKAIRMDQLVEQ